MVRKESAPSITLIFKVDDYKDGALGRMMDLINDTKYEKAHFAIYAGSESDKNLRKRLVDYVRSKSDDRYKFHIYNGNFHSALVYRTMLRHIKTPYFCLMENINVDMDLGISKLHKAINYEYEKGLIFGYQYNNFALSSCARLFIDTRDYESYKEYETDIIDKCKDDGLYIEL